MAGNTYLFEYNFRLASNNNGTFTVGARLPNNYVVQDYTDTGTQDNLAQLGDISGDHFNSSSPQDARATGVGIFIGSLPNKSFVGEFGTFGYFLYTSRMYQAGDVVTPQASQPFDIPCFVSGTSIRTDRGDLVVEQLVAGGTVVTAEGRNRRIKWLGHSTVDCTRSPHPHKVMPIRIAANAFSAGRPSRDLLVSPGHAICVDVCGEVLVPAAALVNGTTVTQIVVDKVTYWHVELDSHDILLAENLPVESYLDVGNRAFFLETEVVALAPRPDGEPAGIELKLADYCRPFHTDGSIVEAARLRLERVGTRAAAIKGDQKRVA